MAIKLADTLAPMSEFPAAMAEHIGFSDGATLQEKFDNKELGGGDSSVTLTQQEYEALTEEQKLDGLYYTYDTKRIYKNGIQYGASEPIQLTMEEYKALKEAGAIDEQQKYLIEADAEGILLGAEDIGYNNAESGIQATTVQGAIDKVNANLGELSKNIDLTSKVVIRSPNLTPEQHRVIRNNNVVMITGRIKVDTALVKDDIIFSGLPKLQETSMYLDAALFDHIPDIASGYVRLNSDGSIVADNAIQPGLYRFSLCYITSDI